MSQDNSAFVRQSAVVKRLNARKPCKSGHRSKSKSERKSEAHMNVAEDMRNRRAVFWTFREKCHDAFIALGLTCPFAVYTHLSQIKTADDVSGLDLLRRKQFDEVTDLVMNAA